MQNLTPVWCGGYIFRSSALPKNFLVDVLCQKDRRINIILYSKFNSRVVSVTSLVISSAHWQQASKLGTLPSAVSSFLMKNSAIQKLSIIFIIIIVYNN